MATKQITGTLLILAAAIFSLHARAEDNIPDYVSATNRNAVVATPVGYQKE